MKKTALLAMGLLLWFGAFAQYDLQKGIRIGVNSASIRATDLLTTASDTFEISNSTMKIGFHAGVLARFELLELVFVQPEVLFCLTSAEMEVKNVVTGKVEAKTLKFGRIDVPIIAAFKTGPIKWEAGPVGSILIYNKSDLFSVADYEEKFNRASWGAQVGVGLDLLDMATIDLKYEFGLSKLGDGVEVAGQTRTFDSRMNQLLLSVGVFF